MVKMSEGELCFVIDGEVWYLVPDRHCWELQTRRINKKTGEEEPAKRTWHRDLSQVGRWLGEKQLRATPDLEAGIAAVNELAAALRGMANQLEQPRTPWAA